MFVTVVAGFFTGLSLIVAIGAQNAFVLRQGLRRQHVLLSVAVCALSDLLLIILGVANLGLIIQRAPGALAVIRWAGVVFLVGYGLLAARRAIKGQHQLAAGGPEAQRWQTVLAACLAFTWLNPHVYLDTVLLLGSIANSHGPSGRWWFAGGAGAASIAWFTALGYGARLLTPVFSRPAAWRVLDALIAVVMFAIAAQLALSA